MTDTEIKTQRDHEERMRNLRAEFATAVWPKIMREIGHRSADMPPVHAAAWLGFLAGKTFEPEK